MISLFGNCNGVGGVIGSQLYISTYKVGSTALRSAATPGLFFFFDQDNLIDLVNKFTSKTGVDKKVCLILRDPEERLFTGAAQNSVRIYLNNLVFSNSYRFEHDLHFSNSKNLIAYRDFALTHAKNWYEKGIPSEHQEVVRTLMELYFKKTINKEVYYEPHVMPFYTSVYNLFSTHKIEFFTTSLEDINFKFDTNNMAGLRHSNGNFRDIIREVYQSIDDNFLKDIIKKEKHTVEHLKTFHSKPKSQLV